MAWASQLAATCHALVALASFRLGLDGNITLWGKLGAVLSQGALLLRTVIQLALGHHIALSNTLCGWCGCTGLLANSVLVTGMAYTIQKTLAGVTTSPETMEVVQKIVQHCGSGISYFTTTWFTLVDQSYASLVLPEWGVIILAEVHYTSAMILHAASLPGQSIVIHAVILQLCMILLPSFLRRKLFQHSGARAPQQQPKDGHGCSSKCADANTSIEEATCGSEDACAGKVAALAPASICGANDGTANSQEPSGQAALRVAQSLVSATTKAQCKPARYVSVLGPAIQPLCLKIDTPLLEPEHLSVDAPQLLATALAHASQRLGDEMLMLGMSVRRGCILIAVQTFQPCCISKDTDSMNRAVRMSEELLPGLLVDLGLASDAGAVAQLMGPGTSMSLQQGTQLVQATYQPSSAKWNAVPQPMAFSAWIGPNGLMRPPQLGLVTERRAPQHERISSNSYGSSSSIEQPDATGTHATTPRPHTVTLEVAVSCGRDAASLLIVGGAGTQLHGKTAAAGADVAEVEDPSVLQLCALGEEGYLPACILKQTPTVDGSSMIVEVEVQLQASGLVHHHPGGPCAAIQPLCLQLWCGKLLLSSSHVLLGLSPSAAAACEGEVTHETAKSSRFGWWGTPAAMATAAAAELQAELLQAATTAAADAAATADDRAAVQELVRDVCYWLAGVRHMACTTQWCMCTRTGSTRGGLPASTLLLLADSLSEYASSWGLPNLHAMVQQQQRLVAKLQQRASRTTPKAGSATTAATAAADAATGSMWSAMQQHVQAAAAKVKVALFGLACMQCEQLVMQQMYANLSQASVCFSCISGVGTAVAIGRQPNPSKHLLSWLLALWALAHVGMCAVRFLSQPQHGTGTKQQTNRRAMLALRVLSLTSFVTKLAMVLIVTVRSVHRLGIFTRQHKSGTWVLMHLHPVLADHMQLQSVLPQHIITLLMPIEYVFFFFANKQVHGWFVSVAGTAGVVLLSPLLLRLYARARGSAAVRRASAAQTRVASAPTQHDRMGKLKTH